jgi:hypothetical protein
LVLESELIAYNDTVEVNPNDFDMTALLMAGQQKAQVAIIRFANRKGNIQYTVAGPQGWNFVKIFGLQGGMPNRVTLLEQDIQEREIIARIVAAAHHR